ncbi:MAG: sigma-70 family RNA polymerase sigma factor [Anaerolineales bacterium]
MAISTALTDKTLVRRAQQGEAEAFTALYHQYAPALVRYFLLRRVDVTTAEDLTAEVFVRVIEGLGRYRDTGAPLAAWLFRIAHDRLVDHIRHWARHPITPLSELMHDLQADPETLAVEALEAAALMRAIAVLNDEQKLVVQLRFIEGYNVEVTAQIMQKSMGAVKALQHRAMSNLSRKVMQ